MARPSTSPRPAPPATVITFIVVGLALAIGLAGCDDELVSGMCQMTADCAAGQRCETTGPNFHRCVPAAGSDALRDGIDETPDAPIDGDRDAGARNDGAHDSGGPSPDAPVDHAPPIACTTAGQCNDPTRPFCQGGQCVGCGSPDAGACVAPLGTCDNASGACVECLSFTQCGKPELPLCQQQKCSACATGGGDAGCKARDPARPLCAGSGRCAECTTNDHCKANLARPFCVAESCAPCTQAGANACTGATPVCNAASGGCVACVADADCKQDAAPFCVANQCVPCSMVPADRCAALKPALPTCGPTGACVECNGSSDCKLDPNRPICNPTEHTCRACGLDSECLARAATGEPGICLDNRGGRCATAAETIYVANSAGCGPGAGTQQAPLCLGVDAAALFSPTRSLVVLRGVLAGFSWTLTSGTPVLTVVGQDAILAGGAGSGLGLDGPGEALVRGITVRGSQAAGVRATGGATLRLRNAILQNNDGGGLLIDNARFEVRSTLIADNGPGQTGATSWGGVLVLGDLTPRLLENVSIKNNRQIGLACFPAAVTARGLYVKMNVGTDDQPSCNVTSCASEGATCGAGATQ